MAFEHRDRVALEKARDFGILVVSHGVVQTDFGAQFFYEIQCPCDINIEEASRKSHVSAAGMLLSDAINAQTRVMANAYIWVSLDCDELPQYVRDAVEDLHGFGTRMVVTNRQACSHAPGERLDTVFCQAVLDANGGGHVWHPFAEKLVRNVP